MPKYSLAALLALNSRANIAHIELSVLQQLYDTHLRPYTFRFELSNGDVFKLNFDPDKFCHLIGLDKVPKALVAAGRRGWYSKRAGTYKGQRGWDNILNGTYDMAHLNALAAGVAGGLGDAVRKMVNFYYLPRLIRTGNLVIDYANPQPGTAIHSELILYNTHDNHYLQIGMCKDATKGWYFPETFMVNTAGPGFPNPRVVGNTVHIVTTRGVLNRQIYEQKLRVKRGSATIVRTRGPRIRTPI